MLNKIKCNQSDVQWHSAHSVNAQLNRCGLSLDFHVTTVGAHLISSESWLVFLQQKWLIF